MTIEAKSSAVESLFLELNQEIKTFQDQTKLSCNVGCGKCCAHPQIDASPLEFLPWAMHLFLNNEAENVLEKLGTSSDATCFVYRPIGLLENGVGSCKDYQFRGLICRLFGYGATSDKYGKLRLATCKIIKKEQPEGIKAAELLIQDGTGVPIFTNYYMRLSQIDHNLGNTILPINEALKIALEEVLRHYFYNPIPNNPSVVA